MKKNLRRAVTLSILAAFCGSMFYAGSAQAGYTLTIDPPFYTGRIDDWYLWLGRDLFITDESGNMVKNIKWYHDGIPEKIYLQDSSGNNIASGNTINIKRGITDSVIGGLSSIGNVSENIVNIDGEVSAKNVYGGYIDGYDNDGSREVSGNIVNSGGRVEESVYGGYACGRGELKVSRNIVNITGGGIYSKGSVESVYGGYIEKYDGDGSREVSESIVNIDGDKVRAKNVYGGYSLSGTVSRNVVNISEGSVDSVYGGYAKESVRNVVNISEGHVDSVYGGYAYGKREIEASGNVVNISEGSIGSVCGGYGKGDYEVKVCENVVNINGGSVSYHVYGGGNYGRGESEVSGNIVNISGGFFSDNINIYGGKGRKGDVKDNIIKLKGSRAADGESNNFDASNVNFFGGYGGSIRSGNALVIDGWSGTVKSLNDFDIVKFINIEKDFTIDSLVDSDLSNADIYLQSLGEDLGVADNIEATYTLNGIKIDPDKIKFFEDENGQSINNGYTYSDNGDNGVRVYELEFDKNSLNVETDGNNNKITVSGDVKKSILTGVYIDGNNKKNRYYNTASNEPEVLIDDGFKTNAKIISGSYAKGNNAATGGRVIITDSISADALKDKKIYAGYSESGAITGNKITLNHLDGEDATAFSNLELHGHNEKLDASVTEHGGNELIINGWDGGNIKGVESFDVVKFTNTGVAKADAATQKIAANSINTFADNQDATHSFTITDNDAIASDWSETTIYIQSLGEDVKTTSIIDNQDDLKISYTLNNIKLVDNADDIRKRIKFFEDGSNGYTYSDNDDNGVRVYELEFNKDSLNVSTTNVDNKLSTTITVSGDVTKSILTGVYIDGDKEENRHINEESDEANLIIDEDFKTNAAIITGVYAKDDNKADDGTVIINANYNGTVHAGYSEEGEVGNNTIILNSNVNANGLTLKGTNQENGNSGTVIVSGGASTIKSIENFESITFDNVAWDNGTDVLTISQGTGQSLANTKINLDDLLLDNSHSYNVGESMKFIDSVDDRDLGIKTENVIGGKNFTSGVAIMGTGEAKVENSDLIYTITDKRTQPQVDLVAQSHAITAAFVNQGGELVADGIASLTQDTNYGTKTFAVVYGNRSKYDVNSDIKINGWSGIIGVGNEKKIADGDLSWGIFFENGSGNYRTYNSFNDDFFRGDGSVVYNGGGVMARLEQGNNVYYEASLRAGMVKNENTNALKDASGASYGYKTESTYCGAHLGIGKVITLDSEQDLDVYGKFFHTYTGGDSFTAAGDKFELGSINSDRLQIGAKLTTNKNNKWSTSYGLAWEYEFNGDSDVTAAGMRVPEQSLQGSSFIGEIGLHFAADKKSPWSMDAKLRGYAGEREGFSGNVQVNYSF